MQQYLSMMRHVRDNGARKEDRTGTGTLSVFGHQMRFDLGKGFPLVTTKKLHTKSIIHELLWFLRGDSNVRYLQENGISIWNEWADDNGELGPIYGVLGTDIRRAVAQVANSVRRNRRSDQGSR
jgi:thymidylate synthase